MLKTEQKNLVTAVESNISCSSDQAKYFREAVVNGKTVINAIIDPGIVKYVVCKLRPLLCYVKSAFSLRRQKYSELVFWKLERKY